MSDQLVDRRCVILDGSCDCPRLEGKSLPECKLWMGGRVVPPSVFKRTSELPRALQGPSKRGGGC